MGFRKEIPEIMNTNSIVENVYIVARREMN